MRQGCHSNDENVFAFILDETSFEDVAGFLKGVHAYL